MTLEVSKLIKGIQNQLDFEFQHELEASFKKSIGVNEVSVFDVTGTVTSIADRLELTLSYSGKIVFECHRCLKDVSVLLDENVKRMIISKAIDSEEEEDFILLKNHELLLIPILEEEIALNLPLQVLCDENCNGLCPTCGKNLNDKPCQCDQDQIDPRLEALKHFIT